MATLDSNKVTGVSVVSNASDAANKSYTDTLNYGYASPSGNSGKFLSAYPGTTYWQLRTGSTPNVMGGDSSYGNAIAYGNNVYASAGQDGAMQTSTDTITWTLRTAGFRTTFGTASVIGLIYANNIFVAGGFQGILNTSTDAIVWILRTSALGESEILSLTYLNQIYLAGSVNGVHASTNAIVWSLQTSAITTQIYSVGVGPNLYLAGGQTDASISTSTDTINWTLRTSGISSQNIRSISYGNGIYLVSGSSANTLISSTNAIEWTLRTSRFGSDVIYSLLYATGSHIAFGQSGKINVSTDGVTWTIRTSNTANNLYGSSYSNDIIIAGGANGAIVTTPVTQQYWQTINSTSTSLIDRVSYKGYKEFTSSGAQTYYVPSSASQFYIEVIGAGGGGSSGKLTPSVLSGGGGGAGAYNSWLIRRGELGNAETITVTIGAKGIGGTTPTAGGNTTLTWTGNSTSGTATYTLTSLGGNAASNTTPGSAASVAVSTLNPLYGAQGSSGASGRVAFGLSDNITQSLQFQVTGGGGGGFVNNDGGYSRTYYYGNTFTANGGVPGADGDNGIDGSYTGSYGSGGGGGGALFSGFTYWQQKNSRFGSTSINSISGDTSPIYISVGNFGTLTTSTNSHDWTLRTSGFGTTNITHLIFGNIHIASGDFGRLTASTDGISWRLRTSGFGATNINALTYFNGEYLIGGRIETVSWTHRTSGNLSNIVSSYFALNQYLAGYNQGSLISSTNSIQWSSRTSGFGTSSINAISFFNGEYLIGGRRDLGIAWILRTSGFGTTSINNLFYTSVSGDLYISAGTSGSIPRLSVSTDGIAWTLRTAGISTSTATSSVFKLNYFNGEYLLGGRIESITWTLRTTGLNVNNLIFLNSTTYSNNEFLIGGQYPTISWRLRTVALSTSNFISSAYGGSSNLFFLGSDTGVLQVSTDGIAWVLRTSGFGTSRIDSISYTEGITPSFYIISGGLGRLATSTDSIAWTLRTSGFGTTTIFTVFSGGGFCIAGGANSGRVSASTNGINWALRTVGSSTFSPFDGFYTIGPNGTASTNNYFITGANPALRHSTDTINWVLRTVGSTAQIGQVGAGDRAITYGNSVYVLGTITGTVHTSTNTIQWSIRTVPSLAGLSVNSVSFGNGIYILNGSSGFTSSSTNGIIWQLRTSGFGTSSIISSSYDSIDDICIISGSGIVCSGNSDSVTTQGKGVLLSASTDTINWNIRTSPLQYENIQSSLNGTTFVGGNSNGAIAIVSAYSSGIGGRGIISSTDNINWLLRTVGFSTGSPLEPVTVGYANNLYFAGSSSGTSNFIATSTNTIEWTLRTVAGSAISSNNPTIFGYGNGLYVASLGSNGGPQLVTSTDAISWVMRTLGVISSAFINITSFAYGNTGSPTYVIGTRRGVTGIASSTDTIHWTLRTSGISALTTQDLQFNQVFVLASSNGHSATSTNGIIWTIRTTGLELLTTGSGLAFGNNLWISAYTGNRILASTQVSVSQLGNGAFLRASTDTISWVTRSTAPNIVDFSAIGVGPSYVLASGNDYSSTTNPKILMASTDNITWTLRSTNISAFISSILYSNVDNLYLIAGATNTVRVSTDTISWVARTTGITTQQIGLYSGSTFVTHNSIIYKNNIYMLVTNNGSIVTSTNSIEWTLRTSGGFGTTSLNTITYGNGAFIIGGSTGLNASSTDGIMWSLRTSGFGTSNIFSSVFGNGTYLMGGSAGTLASSTLDFTQITGGALLRSSTDGIAWRTREMHPSSFEIDAMGSSDSYIVAAGLDVSSAGFINVSVDNINWISRTSVPNVSTYSGGFAYGSPSGTSYYLLPTGNIGVSALIASTDTISWQIRTVPTMLVGDDVTYGNGIFVLAGDSGKLATSTNSIVWTLRTVASGGEAFTAINYNGGIFVASASISSGLVSVSTDAITWIARTSGFGVSRIDTISVGNNIWIIGGTGGTIQSSTQETLTQFGNGALLRASTDSIAWRTRTTGKNTVQINELQYGDQGNAAGQHSLASGLNYIGQNFLIASTDNINWSERTTGFGSSILSLGYAEGIYLIGGNNGSLLTTTNTISWTYRTSGFGSSSIISITYGSGYYVAASATNISYSTNAIQWQIINPGFGSSSINTLAYQNDRYLAGGTGGSLAVSYPGLDSILAGKGGNGTRGGGGGGGAVVNVGVGSFGVGGDGGDGYVRITWW